MLFLLTVIAIIVFDQAAKYFFTLRLTGGSFINCGVFDIRIVHNTGTAFGLFAGNNTFFVILSLLAIAAISVLMVQSAKKNLLFKICFALILSGAASNLIDRVRVGYVVDYIDFRFWPVFNIADSAITVGTAVLIISILGSEKGKGMLSGCTR
ncbi:MAG: signal peptidase II [Candidatus Omnitrophica bacterium]|nr:signal peptidase II [Candidatus Omnitrophota bacterium]